MLEIGADCVLNVIVVTVEVMELIANLVHAAQIRWTALALGHQVVFVALDHRAQTFRARAIARKRLIANYRGPRGLHKLTIRRGG